MIERATTYVDIVATPAQYYVRHLVVAVIATLGLAAVAVIGRIMSGSWRWGVLCAAVLAAMPMWTGHGMFNGKDIPVATGYTLATLGYVAVAQRRVFESRLIRYGGVCSLVTGAFIAVGTRPGIWPAIAAGALVMLVVSRVVSGRRMAEESAFWVMLARASLLGVSFAIALALLAVVYPRAFLTPVQTLIEAAQVSSDFVAWDGWSLSAGVLHGQPPPWWYVPSWFASQTPVLLLAAGSLGLAASFMLVLGALRGRVPQYMDGIASGVSAVTAQAVLVPVLSIVFGMRVYGGVRQLLFALPALSVVAVAGIWWLAGTVAQSRFGASRAVAVAGPLLLAAALVVPSVDQAKLFPYNYAYFNRLISLKPIDGRWGTDYWQTSYRELARSYRELARASERGATLSCPSRYGLDKVQLTAAYTALPEPCEWPTIAPYLGKGALVGGAALKSDSEFWFVQANFIGPMIPSNCRIADSVTRSLHGQQVTMSYLARCLLQEPDDTTFR